MSGLLLFKIISGDFFFFLKETVISGYADDKSPHISAENIYKLISSLKKASKTIFKWFAENRLKVNADKRHLLVSGTRKVNAKI